MAQKVVDLADRAGIKSTIKPVPSIALGTANISLYEMVSAYSTFVNEGIPVKPVYLLRIEDKNGNTLATFSRSGPEKRALSRETSIMMREMLKSVVNEGTASKIRYQYGLSNDIAGKTGTTQSNADGWFIGITPELIAGVWVGADDPRIHFRTHPLRAGRSYGAAHLARFMQQVNGDKNFRQIRYARFPNPPFEVVEALDCDPFILEEDKGIFDFLSIFKNDEPQPERQDAPQPERRKPRKKKKKNIFDKIGDLFGN